jgi:uncharacterized protein (UPF0276 family)
MGNRFKIATPISHLFENDSFSSQIIELSDCLECRDDSVDKGFKKQELFHCDLQPIHKFTKDDLNSLIQIKSQKLDLKLISFHLASCYEKPKVIKGIFHPNGVKISVEELKYNAHVNIRKIKEIFGESISISVENNNYYKTEAYDYITDPDFINSIVLDNDINFLFDISHAKISATNSRVDYHEYLSKLPLNRVNQIHISKEGFNSEGEVFDAHELPSDQETKEIFQFIKNYNTLKYITVEYYKDASKLVAYLNKLKSIL